MSTDPHPPNDAASRAPEPGHAVEEHDLGLQHDLATLGRRGFVRRGLLGLGLGLGGLGALAACSESGTAGGTGAGAAGGAPSPTPAPQGSEPLPTGALEPYPDDMVGPFPADGSNGPDILEASGVVRRDITRSIGTATGVATGVPLTVRMRQIKLGETVSARAGAAVYVWHCDRAGEYSMYDGPLLQENYLRGVQTSDENGWVEFTTIFPGCYPGRWPHIHFEVFPGLESARLGLAKLRTSQLAFPEKVCREVYRAPGYEVSAANLPEITLETDLVFSDGWALQMAEVTGNNTDGWVATLNVPV